MRLDRPLSVNTATAVLPRVAVATNANITYNITYNPVAGEPEF
jgi:hypothetical protein